MKPIYIEVNGSSQGLCSTGIPFPKGLIKNLDNLAFSCGELAVDNFSRPLSYWPDGSIRWLHLSFFHHPDQTGCYQLTEKQGQALPKSNGIELAERNDSIAVKMADRHFLLDLEKLRLLKGSQTTSTPLIANLAGALSLAGSINCPARYKEKCIREFIDINSGEISSVQLEITGHFSRTSEKHPLAFKTILSFFNKLPLIKLQTTLINPNAARHPDGLWELGDQGSEDLSALKFQFSLGSGSTKYQISPGENLQSVNGTTCITQFSSGGENWKSPVHVDKKNQVPLQKNGFEIQNQDSLLRGKRATPVIYGNDIAITVEKFWQNFPASLELTDDCATLDLFPQLDGHCQELQGGEQKTHTFWLDLKAEPETLDWVHTPPVAKPDTCYLEDCQALPYLIQPGADDRLYQLIGNGLEHRDNFFNKRETIDEYGWRHFGDLYADHETVGHTTEELFVSHYNNQYDPVFGFLRQYLLSGDQRWFELADDLARHVTDIDIYHTDKDKAEYNGGLFWHTDHYQKAFNATHRSYSGMQTPDAYEDRAGGGGPGGQHCYTTGLMWHYFITGEESSRQAVIGLTDWITNYYEGTNSCLELLQAIRIRHVPGLKNHLTGQYPLDRGTANYIIALLDSYQLTTDGSYLSRAEHIIQHTLHPADNIESRQLQNIEECWFYTVLLQAVCRYLLVKESISQFDDNYYYARDSLLHYADWMLAYEYPYLEKPEVLEFPNDTWVAQDLRKAEIFAAAAYYSSTAAKLYGEKARFFEDYVAETLHQSEEKTFTRILALLMQNYSAVNYYIRKPQKPDHRPRRFNWPQNTFRQERPLWRAASSEFLNRIQQFSPQKEMVWLEKRLRG